MKLIAYILFFLLPTTACAQLKLSAGIGTGTYKMTALRDITENRKQGFAPFPAKIVDNFPSYYIYDLGLTMVFDNGLLIGGGFSYASTGSRVSYSDYSGRLQFDVTTKSISYGTSIGYRQSLQKDMFLTLDFRHGTTQSYVDMVDSQGPAGSADQSSLYIQPTAIFSKVYKRISFDAHLGYFVSIRAASYQINFSNSGTTSSSANESLIADWSGIRAGISVGYILSKKKQVTEQ